MAVPALTRSRTAGDAELISLREYCDIRFDAQEKQMAAALAAQAAAVSKAEVSTDKRFEAVNEFRASLNDQTRTLVPRAEHEQAVRGLAEKVEVLTSRVNQRDDRGHGMGALAGWIVSGVLLLVAIAGLSFKALNV